MLSLASFMPPEVLFNFQEINPLADQYSVAAVMYHLADRGRCSICRGRIASVIPRWCGGNMCRCRNGAAMCRDRWPR